MRRRRSAALCCLPGTRLARNSVPNAVGVLATLVAVGAPMVACSQGPTTANKPVLASAPPKDDGKPAKGGAGGTEHAAALEELKVASVTGRTDQQGSLRIALPDAQNWTRVRFWSVPSLVGFRYGKDHHAIVAAFVTHVEDNTAPGACQASFETWAQPWIDAFEVDVSRDPPNKFPWRDQELSAEPVFAQTATLTERDAYAAAYVIYPVWKKACLVAGVAIPSRGDDPRARQVRDRFVKEILPKIEILADSEPPERF